MDLESSPGNLDDGVLDHQLRRALQVDPSPEFLARVRARVAEETPAGRWHGWSLRTSAAVAMAGVIVSQPLPCIVRRRQFRSWWRIRRSRRPTRPWLPLGRRR